MKLNFILISVIFVFYAYTQDSVLVDWIRNYQGPTSSNIPISLLGDKFGNIYVIGESRIGPDSLYIVILKYDSLGNQLWIVQYDSSFFEETIRTNRNAAIDNFGNIYINCLKKLMSSVWFNVTLKFGPEGRKIWEESNNFILVPIGIEVDSYGNCVIAGFGSLHTEDTTLVVIKYDSSGQLLWNKGFGDIQTTAFTANDSGNIYLTGYNIQEDIKTLKINSNGSILWIDTLSVTESDIPKEIFVDPDGNIFVAGDSWDLSDPDIILIKYDQHGNKLWKSYYQSPHDDTVTDLSIDHYGNIYVVGENASNYNLDILIVKFKNTGQILWARLFTTVGYEASYPVDMEIDYDSGVIVAGVVIDNMYIGNSDMVTIKYDSAGNLKWSEFYNSPFNEPDYSNRLLRTGNHDFYITGHSDIIKNYDCMITTIHYKRIVFNPTIDNDNPKIEKFILNQNYPNPFNPSTTISYQLPYSSQVEILVFNTIGQKVKILVDNNQIAGRHKVIWDGTNDDGQIVSSGIYIYRLKSEHFTQTRKMLMIR